MRGHLDAGCAACSGSARFCASLQEVLGASATVVPSWAVQRAKNIFPRSAPLADTRRVLLPLETIYDSFLAPAFVGLRGHGPVAWQALYRAGKCFVDRRIDPILSWTRATVVGQISSRLMPEEETQNCPVTIEAGGATMAETRCNRFGEFQLEYEEMPRLELYIHLAGGTKVVKLRLKQLTRDHAKRAGSGLLAAGERLRQDLAK